MGALHGEPVHQPTFEDAQAEGQLVPGGGMDEYTIGNARSLRFGGARA